MSLPPDNYKALGGVRDTKTRDAVGKPVELGSFPVK